MSLGTALSTGSPKEDKILYVGIYSAYTLYVYRERICETRFAKARHNYIFCIARNTNYKYSRRCNSLMPQGMDAKFTVLAKYIVLYVANI